STAAAANKAEWASSVGTPAAAVDPTERLVFSGMPCICPPDGPATLLFPRPRTGVVASPPDAPCVARLLQHAREHFVRKNSRSKPAFPNEQEHAAGKDREANATEGDATPPAGNRGQGGRAHKI